MQKDFLPHSVSEPRRAITLRYRGWSVRPAHGFPAAGLFGFRNASVLHSMGHAGMSASQSPERLYKTPTFRQRHHMLALGHRSYCAGTVHKRGAALTVDAGRRLQGDFRS